MSDEPDVTERGPDAPPGRLAGVLPPWVRRRPLISAITAGVLVAALIAGYILAAAPFSPAGPRYASVPARSVPADKRGDAGEVPARLRHEPAT
jgi:hypothetical protein